MLLSIITPCYNAGNYIEEAINSILIQKNKNIELILVDDGSTDCTQKICEKYVNGNIQYIKTENLGAGHARNIGIKKARGRWISFLDSDDLYLTHSLNHKFCDTLSKYLDEGIDIVYTPRIKIDMQLTTYPKITNPEEIQNIKNHIPELEFWTCIYNTAFLKNNNITFYEYKKQDIETAFRFLAFSNTKNIVINTEMKFYLQRNNLQSNTHTWNLYNLYEIKGKVYYDLYKRTKNEEVEVKLYLLKTAILQVYLYFRLCILKGCDSHNSKIEEMHLLFNKIKQCKEISKILFKVNKQYIITYILDKYYKKISKRTKKAISINKNKALEKNNLEEIMLKLEDLSKELINID